MKVERIKNIRKKSKGITLVALVVTIVVLIILATISINLIFRQDGILERAKQSKQEIANSQELEDSLLATYNNKIYESVSGTREQIMVDKEQYTQLLSRVEALEAKTFQSSTIEGTYIGTGKYGANNPKTLEFEEAPKIIIISTISTSNSGTSAGVIFIQGCQYSTIGTYGTLTAGGIYTLIN